MKDSLTPKQVALAIGVSESSLKRWCDRGLIPMTRTAGGHRRLPVAGVIHFLRESGHEIVRPEILGLPRRSGRGAQVLSGARTTLVQALVEGDETAARQVVLDLYLSGRSTWEICDSVIASAFREIGDGWECGRVAVWQERRGCEIAVRMIHELRGVMENPPPEAPLAIGGTASGDQYAIPTVMVELVLREQGWRATSLGTSLPFSTLQAAVEENRPRLFWLSASYVVEEESFVEGLEELHATTRRCGTTLVVGGRALHGSLRERLSCDHFCADLGQLVELVDSSAPGATE